MPQKSLELTATNLPSPPSDALVRLVEKSSDTAERGILIGELIAPVAMSFAPHLDRADVRALVDRLAFA